MPLTLLPPPVTREDFLRRRVDSLRGHFRRVVFTRALCRCFVVVTLALCTEHQGQYQGDNTVCVPSPCPPIPTENTSWGQIKSQYR